MKYRFRRCIRQVVCFALISCLFTTEVSAAFKEIPVGGAWSVNDMGLSDNRVTMDEVKDDYRPYRQTNWLTEYFHKDQETPRKVDLGEAVSWLIDNGIINRDVSVSISNIYPADTTEPNALPSINIKKVDIGQYLSTPVNRSDMIMYLYKAVFGSIDARTVGVEVPNIRTDNGAKKTLWKMMDDHEYWETIQNPDGGIMQSESAGGHFSQSQKHVIEGDRHTDTQSQSGTGGSPGGQQVNVQPINTSSRWRYTPQGDEYESMFGDTNIFVSDVDIGQQANTGAGQLNQTYMDMEAGASGSQSGGSLTGTNEGDNHASGNHQTQTTNMGGTGGINAAISYESDYKQIYYTPGSDLLFYRADDCVELYIQYALSKGLLSSDPALKTDKYQDVFLKDVTGTASATPAKMNVWSPVAPAFIPNKNHVIINTTEDNVKKYNDPSYVKTRFAQSANKVNNVLGENYEVQYVQGTPATLTITRKDLFRSNTGYFSSERISRMQFYKYVYDFINGSEKKMSSLETEIINYKYGMQIDALGDESEVKVMKYLIAKGILDYTDNYDFQNLNAAIPYSDFLVILYRIANPDARLDFSKVQLTDSESQWQAAGYSSHTMAMSSIGTTKMTGTSFGPNSDVTLEDADPMALVYSNESDPIQTLSDFVTEDDSGVSRTKFGAPMNDNTAVVSGTGFKMGVDTIHGMTFSFRGAYLDPKSGGSAGPVKVYDITKYYNVGGTSATADNYFYHVLDYYLAEFLANDEFLDWWATEAENHGGQSVAGVRTLLQHASHFLQNLIHSETAEDGSKIDVAAKYDDVPYLDCYYYMCTNVYVIAMFKNGDLNWGQFKTYMDEKKSEAPGGIWGSIWGSITGKERARKAYNSLIDHLYQVMDSYVNGENSPKSISFKLDSDVNVLGGGSIGSSSEFKSAVNMGRGNMYHALANAAGNLSSITVTYNVNGTDKDEVWIITRNGRCLDTPELFGDTADALTAAKLWEVGDKADFSVTMETKAGSAEEAEVAASRAIGRLDYNTANSLNLSLNLQSPSDGDKYGGFVSWAEISKNEAFLHIEQLGDCILHNKVTDTYAYFPPDGVDYKYALVGSALVEGDPDEGVAKEMDGQYWYWFDAVRLLIGIQGESSVLGGVEGITLPAKAVTVHTQDIPVVSESGFQGSSLNTIRLRLGKEESFAGLTNAEAKKFVKSQPAVDGYRWANYVASSTSNRALNMVSRKITYSPGVNTNAKQVAFALVFLRPTKINGTASVTKEMSLEETLDSVAREPVDDASKAIWQANKQLCNDTLNWIYGTTKQEYINTGYLKPEIYVYAETAANAQLVPASAFGEVTEEMKAKGIMHYGSLNPITDGMVDDPGIITASTAIDQPYSVIPGKNAKGEYDEMYKAAYYLSDDYRIAILGDRVLVHERYIPNLSGYQGIDTGKNDAVRYRYRLVNQAVQQQAFYVGRTFNLGFYTDDYLKGEVYTPKMTVIAMEDGGNVRAQIGPIFGLPCKIDGEIAIINPDWVLDEYSSEGGLNTTLGAAKSNVNTNIWKYVKEKMLSDSMANIKWTNKIVEYPVLQQSPVGERYAVFTGNNLKIYGSGSAQNSVTTWNSGALIATGANTVKQLQNDKLGAPMVERGLPSANYTKYIETYAEVEFSAYDYVVRNNSLISVNSGSGLMAGDIFSPSLFVCINDMIIEEMIFDSKAAIPLKQVPEGGLVQVGEGWYIAANADENNKKFVGYAPLDNFSGRTWGPKIQDAALSMSNHFIRGGNQYINITHYITDFTVLNDSADTSEESYKHWESVMRPLALTKLKDTTMTTTDRYACPAESSVQYSINTGNSLNSTTGNVGYHYAPVMLQFNDLLHAYPISSGGSNPVYKICNFAKASASGTLSQLPFFASDALNARLNDVTTTVVSGGYTYDNGSRFLMDSFKAQFEKAFAGDLFTLVRMLLFIVLVWLFVMSWVCYGFYWSRLMPMVDAICHPTGDRQGKGIDLFKIFSLGTISVDSDFKLGRFLQYDLIIAILILVVWKSGNITF